MKKGKFYSRHVIEKSLRHHVIEWLATAGSIIGVLIVSLDMKEGYAIWVVANALWISFALKHKHYGLLLLSGCYFVINLVALVRWLL